jgi:integrase
MGRRGAGEGSVFYDQTKGLWVGIVDLSAGGARQRKTVRSKDKNRMLAKMRAVQARADAGLGALDDTVTTGRWLGWWLDNYLPGTVSESSLARYRWRVENWVIPYVGRVRLSRLGPEHVVTMMGALEKRGLAVTSRRSARTVLRMGLQLAYQWGKAPLNAAALVKGPAATGVKLDDALDAAGAAAVLDTAAGDPLEALAWVVLSTGLRRGEALALRWDDLRLDRHPAVTVQVAKTPSGVRTVALPAQAATALRQHRTRQRKERMAAPFWADPGLVFATAAGTPIPTRSVLRWWHQLTIAAGVGRRRFHASRHTAATLMLNNGVPLEVVSATLGHAGLAITADVYAKVRPQLQRTAATAMEGVLGGGGR